MRKLSTGVLCVLALNAHANVIQFFAAGVSYSNPADLYTTKHSQFVIGSTAAHLDMRFNGSVYNFNTYQYGSGVNSSKTNTMLPYGRLATRFNEKMVLSLDVTEPFNSNLDWGQNAFTRYANTENFLTDVDVSPKFSYDVNEKLHVGAGINFNFITNNEVNFALPTGETTYANLYNKSASFGLGYNLGATYMINQMNFLGILYYSPIQQNTSGDSTLGPNINSNFSVALRLPSTTSVSYVHIINQKWLVNLKAYLLGWDSLQTVYMYNTAATPSDMTFQMHYKNALAFQGAVRNQVTEKMGLTLIGMIDNSPAQEDLRSLPFPADTQYLVGLAADYHFNQSISAELLYGHVFSTANLQNSLPPAFGSLPFTTGNVNINANVVDLKLKIEA